MHCCHQNSDSFPALVGVVSSCHVRHRLVHFPKKSGYLVSFFCKKADSADESSFSSAMRPQLRRLVQSWLLQMTPEEFSYVVTIKIIRSKYFRA